MERAFTGAVLLLSSAFVLAGCDGKKSEDQRAKIDEAYNNGLSAAKSGDYSLAQAFWSPIAQLGDGLTQEALGERYEKGIDVKQNNTEAERWYRLAAQQGRPTAQERLCFWYATKLVWTEKVKWCRLTAQRGDASAQHMLGFYYANGLGVPQNYARAHMWFNIAASHTTDGDNKENTDAREDVAAKMAPAQIAEAQALAARCVAANYKNCD